MASEDVIELGSSDEDAQPAPKRANLGKPGKPKPNAMVQIPPGVTIKPSKSTHRNINPIKDLMGKGLIVKKVNSSKHQPTNIRNGKPPPTVTSKSYHPPVRPIIAVPKSNPIKVKNVKSINTLPSSITVTKKPSGSVLQNAAVSVLKSNVIGISPMIPIKGIPPKMGVKRPAGAIVSNVKKKQKVKPHTVATINLDDEEVPTVSSASPQWYLRPEESSTNNEIEAEKKDPLDMQSSDHTMEKQNNTSTEQTIEKQNNTEPKNFIEITIDDSPIKPVHNKRAYEIGAELAITIDDSPVKTTATKEADLEGSEQTPKEHRSKKKLEYLKNTESASNIQSATIEIELEPLEPVESTKTIDNTHNDNASHVKSLEINDESDKSQEKQAKKSENSSKTEREVKRNEKQIMSDVIEVIESPAKTLQTPPTTPKKDATQRKTVKPIETQQETSQASEFHPIYQEFIDLCLQLENSNDMKTIVEKKIKNYYRQVPKEYTESEDFVYMVQSKILSMKAGPEKLYLYIKDIVDELNLQRKMAKAKPPVKEARNIEAEKFQYGEESEFDSKRQRQIRKLEKTLKKLHRAIQKLEEQEVDFDDEEDSVYLLTESDESSSSIKDLDRQLKTERSVLIKRYKERMVRVHAKFCQLTNTKMPSEPRILLEPRPGRPVGPAKRLEKWVNRKVSIGKPLPFPDFHDVLKCVRAANDEDKLGWNEADIMEEARDLFTRCGKKLQRRRQENEWRLAASRIHQDIDPAETSEDLKKKLDSNKQTASRKEIDVFNKYADRQTQLKLEAEEIGDKEAEESPVESEDEEVPEESSNLEDKGKRKERLRRLIQEKSQKNEQKESKDASQVQVQSEEKAAESMETDAHIENKATTSEQNASPSHQKADRESGKEEDVKEIGKKVNTENEVMEIDLANKDNMDAESIPTDTAIESKELNKETSSTRERIHSISGDSKVDSDVDELHLLQKLHSDEVNTSTAETDSDSPIDISDTLTSSGDNKKPSSDVISIENSSYSETEIKDEDVDKPKLDKANNESEELEKVDSVVVPERLSGEIQCSTSGIIINRTNNQEYGESVESILLATSDEEGENSKEVNSNSHDECVNLKDDDISIGETEVEANIDGINPPDKKNNKTSKEGSRMGVNSEVVENKSVESGNKNEHEAELNPEAIQDISEVVKTSDNSQEAGKHDTANSPTGDPQSSFDDSNKTKNTVKNNKEGVLIEMEIIEEISSVETLESDTSQEALKESPKIEETVDESSSKDETHVNLLKSHDINRSAKESEIASLADEQTTEIPSVESLDSDNSQEHSKKGVEQRDSFYVESVESDNSQGFIEESSKYSKTDGEPCTKDNNCAIIAQSDHAVGKSGQERVVTFADEQTMEMGSAETLESDNSRGSTKAVRVDKEIFSAETVESENSQETLTKVNIEQQSVPAVQKVIITVNSNVNYEIHEITDSNSPDQINRDQESDSSVNKKSSVNKHDINNSDSKKVLQVQSDEALALQSVESNNEFPLNTNNTAISKNEETLSSVLEDLESDLEIKDNLVSETSVKE